MNPMMEVDMDFTERYLSQFETIDQQTIDVLIDNGYQNKDQLLALDIKEDLPLLPDLNMAQKSLLRKVLQHFHETELLEAKATDMTADCFQPLPPTPSPTLIKRKPEPTPPTKMWIYRESEFTPPMRTVPKRERESTPPSPSPKRTRNSLSQISYTRSSVAKVANHVPTPAEVEVRARRESAASPRPQRRLTNLSRPTIHVPTPAEVEVRAKLEMKKALAAAAQQKGGRKRSSRF